MNLQAKLKAAWRALRVPLSAVAALLLIYALAGFLLVPWLAKRELPRLVEEQSQCRARIGEIAFNPFTLKLRADDFALEEKNGQPLLGFRQAVVDLEWSSLFRRAWVLAEIRLVRPAVRVEISKDGRINLAALAPPSEAGASKSEPVRFAIDHFVVENGDISFDDQREGYANGLEGLSLDLSSLSTLSPDKGPYTLVAQTQDGATLRWKGEISLQPLATTGTIALEHEALAGLNPYLDNVVAARVLSGRADVELPYQFTVSDGEPRLDIHDAKLVLSEFALAAQGSETQFLKFSRFAIEGIKADLQARRASAAALRVSGLALAVNRDANGKLDLQALLPVSKGGSAPVGAGPSWQATVAAVELDNGSLSFADRGSGLTLSLERLTAKLGEVSSDTSKPLSFEIAAALGSGKIAARGRATPASRTLEGHIEASGVPLALLQPLLPPYTRAKLASGEISLAGDLRAGSEGPKLTYAGSAAMANVTINDGNGARLLAWKSLATGALQATLQPTRVQIDELVVKAPMGKLAIAADQTTNVSRVFRVKETAPAPVAIKTRDKPDEASAFAVAIRRIRIEQGGLDFSDDSLSPGFSAIIRELSGTINGVSSDRSTRSQFRLEGRVDKFGFARLSGAVNPFAPRDRTDFRVQFRNLDVATVSPYSMRFAGYRIASGRLSMDLNYRVRENRLEGDNKIVLEKFTLGERVESPTALKLPLELAVALLKDKDGKIDIAVPISGNLDDPKFSYGALIWKALGNLFGRIIAAPFSALAHLLGGSGEEVGNIAFDPGSSRLLPPEQEKLERIVKALAQRTELKVAIQARYDSEADARAMKRAALRREVGKRAGFAVSEDDDAATISIDDRPTRTALRGLFTERFSAAELNKLKTEAETKAHDAAAGQEKQPSITVLERLRNAATGEPQVVDASEFYRTLIRRLVDSQPLADNALPQLAEKRAAVIAAALNAAGTDAQRIVQSQAAPTANPEAKRVEVQLALTTR
jgi:uncharacterized protein involved in outer membrane biogenesis